MPRKKQTSEENEENTESSISVSESEIKEKPKKSSLSQEEYEKKVVELAKSGLTSEKIGESLRKQNIHPKEYNKKISLILKNANLYKSPDLMNIEKKFKAIEAHSQKNKQDKRAMREKDRVFSQLRTAQKYFAKKA